MPRKIDDELAPLINRGRWRACADPVVDLAWGHYDDQRHLASCGLFGGPHRSHVEDQTRPASGTRPTTIALAAGANAIPARGTRAALIALMPIAALVRTKVCHAHHPTPKAR